MKRKSKPQFPKTRGPRKSSELEDLRQFVRLYEQLINRKTLDDISLESETVLPMKRVRISQLQKFFDRIEQRYKTTVLGTVKPLATTDEGIKLWARARELVNALNGLTMQIDRPVVHIASIDAGVHFWLPPALSFNNFFAKEDFDLDIHTRENWDVVRDVKNGVAEFGIAAWMNEPTLEMIQLISRPHVIVLPRDHWLCRESSLEFKDLDGQVLIAIREGIAPLDIGHVVRTTGVKARIIRTQNSSQVISFVRQRLGLGILTEDMVDGQHGVEWRSIYPTDVFPMAEDIIYTREKEKLTDAANRVINQLIMYWRDRTMRTRA